MLMQTILSSFICFLVNYFEKDLKIFLYIHFFNEIKVVLEINFYIIII